MYAAGSEPTQQRRVAPEAGDRGLAPRRRDKPQAPADCQHAGLSQTPEPDRADSGRLSWAQAMKAAWKVDVLQCDCGGRRSLVALIQQPLVIKKILTHLGLATEALTEPEESVWRVRGPPDELFPPDLDDAGLPVEPDAVDEELSEPFVDELPGDDWDDWAA